MLAWPLGEALAVFGHGCNKKIISMAAWWSIIFFIAMRWWLFNIMWCYRIFFGAEHACMSVAKNTIMPHYVNVASGSFFWRGFLLVCRLAAAAHRNVTQWSEDGLRLHVCGYKNHDIKNWLHHRRQRRPCILAAMQPCLWVGLGDFGFRTDDSFWCLLSGLQDCLLCNLLLCWCNDVLPWFELYEDYIISTNERLHLLLTAPLLLF